MPTWIWILIAVVVVVAAVLAVGLVRARKKTISLRDSAPAPLAQEEKPKPKASTYKAGGSISFSAGPSSGTAVAEPPAKVEPVTPAPVTAAPAAPKPAPKPAVPVAPAPPVATPPVTTPPATSPAAPEHPVADRTETDGQPGVGDDASVPRDSIRPELVDVELPEPAVVEPDTEIAPAVEVPAVEVPAVEVPAAEVSAADEAEVVEVVVETVVVEQIEDTAVVVAETVVVDVPVEAPAAPVVEAPAEAPAAPVVEAPVVIPAVDTPAAPVVEAPAGTELDVIDPSEGRLGRLRSRLSRTQGAFGRSMLGLLGSATLDEDSWTDIEDTLLMADLGAGAATEIADKLRAEVAAHGVASAADARAMLRKVLVEALDPSFDRSIKALPHDGRPSVLLVVGVNGTGKTTTTGKLARVLVADGRTVVLGAADTFRAAAADQLQTWGERVGATIVRSGQGADPAAVAFDAVKKGIEVGADAVLIDTAGRLHTKSGLMDELGKVKRVIEKQAEVDEVLLVLDATTGQNGMVQAKVFAEVVNVTGIALTKLDGTAKGGIVIAVQRALGVPVKLVGLGEGPDDLAPFEPGAFVDALLGE
ncbi:signal recognition particle-docking protein FtsY [Nakamurella silvestris]|nr:signal recognition particle-docking protein FtsY [Nakamurella silvestris]